jgi:hypothetical protein
MTNHHRKGSMWRHAVEEWFAEAGFATTVRGIGYAGDDILARRGLLTLSIEAKNHREINLASFVDQAVEQALDYPDDIAIPVCVIHRPRRATVDDAYVVLPGCAFIELVTR